MDNMMSKKQQNGFLSGKLLIAMPSMEDQRFYRSVVYLISHGLDGAIGIILNKVEDIDFIKMLLQLNLIQNSSDLSENINDIPVHFGGPVEPSRGFILHSSDYVCETTLALGDNISLTTTIDVLEAISLGKGPKSFFIALGYAGWTEKQLEDEISQNSWLTSDVDAEFIFNVKKDDQYLNALKRIKVDPAFLTSNAGHA